MDKEITLKLLVAVIAGSLERSSLHLAHHSHFVTSLN